MLTQDLQMPDVVRVWDCLLSDVEAPPSLLHYMCVAIIKLMRKDLLAGDFAACADLLQRGPPGGLQVEALLVLAKNLRAEDLPSASSGAEPRRARGGSWHRSQLQRVFGPRGSRGAAGTTT